MTVLLLPPRAFMSSFVNVESRYGTLTVLSPLELLAK